MSKKIFKQQGIGALVLIVALSVFSGFRPAKRQTNVIVLKDEPAPVIAKEFYVAAVTDDREDKSAIARLLPFKIAGADVAKPYPVDLQGGVKAAVKQFVDRNLQQDKSLRPVVISIKKINITEQPAINGQVVGQIKITLAFNLQKGEEQQHLADYNGSANYIRNPGPPQDVEPSLRRALVYGLNYLNTWMNKQANGNIKLARGVKVIFSDYAEQHEDDTVYYSVKRPLKWADFKGQPQGGSRFDAEVYVSVGYTENVTLVNGIVNVAIAVKTYMPKSASWVRGGAGSAHSLDHEQRHFDIAKLVAEHFKRKILAENLPVDNYDGPINVEYLEIFREMDRLQKQYDLETTHGLDSIAQAQWSERIDGELKELGVK
ncbi:hypothetical protein BH09BAC6_BH09BAC6_20340 [soil metagenome]|jgi:hypothetical protein